MQKTVATDMSASGQFFLILLSILCLYFCMRGVLYRKTYLSFPFLFSVVILGWYLPQIIGLSSDSLVARQHLEQFLFFTLICFICAVFGWRFGLRVGTSKYPLNNSALLGPSGRANASSSYRFELLWSASALTAIAAILSLLINPSAASVAENGNWTGSITILHFFSNLKFASLFLSVLGFLLYRGKFFGFLLFVNVLIYFPLIFVYFRRRAVIEFMFAVAAAAWFSRGVLAPRLILVIAISVGTIATFAIGPLRAASTNIDGTQSLPTFERLGEIDFREYNPLTNPDLSPEIQNGVSLIALRDERGFSTNGTATWNRLIFQYVPGQIVGQGIKQSLMFNNDLDNELKYGLGYFTRNGTTLTGVGEAYVEFGYLGGLFYLMYGLVTGFLFARSQASPGYNQFFFAAFSVYGALSLTSYVGYGFVMMPLFVIAIFGVRFGARILASRRMYRGNVARTISGRERRRA